jgi:hypothetical protein
MTYLLSVGDLLSFSQVSVIKPSQMQKFRIVSFQDCRLASHQNLFPSARTAMIAK